MNTASRFFNGLAELEMESRIRNFLHRYADFNFDIDYEAAISASGERRRKTPRERSSQFSSRSPAARKTSLSGVSFLAVAQLAIDGQDAYNWVQYIYIDDPISSLDENNAIAVAAHLAANDKKARIGSRW